MWSILRPDLQMQKRTAKTGQSVFPPLLTPPLQKQKKHWMDGMSCPKNTSDCFLNNGHNQGYYR